MSQINNNSPLPSNERSVYPEQPSRTRVDLIVLPLCKQAETDSVGWPDNAVWEWGTIIVIVVGIGDGGNNANSRGIPPPSHPSLRPSQIKGKRGATRATVAGRIWSDYCEGLVLGMRRQLSTVGIALAWLVRNGYLEHIVVILIIFSFSSHGGTVPKSERRQPSHSKVCANIS